MMRVFVVVSLVAALVGLPTCNEASNRGPSSPSAAPVLRAISPSQAAIGDVITLSGSGFAATGNGVKINTGYHNGVASAGGTTITFSLPASLSACPPGTEACIALAIPVTPGACQVSVVNANGTSNALALQVVAR